MRFRRMQQGDLSFHTIIGGTRAKVRIAIRCSRRS